MKTLKLLFWHIIFPPIKKYQIYFKSYKLYDKLLRQRFVLVHMTESSNVSGLADRLKSFVTAYVIAMENGYDLKILHTHGFNLDRYLLPNEINWKISRDNISYGLNKARILMVLYSLPILNKKVKQWHIYGAQNILPFLPQKAAYNWHDVFWKLFTLSPYLKDLLTKSRQIIGIEKYIAIHVRFLDYLEKVEANDSPIKTTNRERAKMINSVLATIESLREKHSLPIILFTDSPSFTKKLPSHIKFLPGNIGHISTRKNDISVADKSFIDLFTMSRAECIYNIVGDGLYPSQFSEIAAYIGNTPYYRINRIRVDIVNIKN